MTSEEVHQPRRAVICLPLCIRLPPFSQAYPDGPSPCPSYYRQAFGYYAASALRVARWHVRGPPSWAPTASTEFPSSTTRDVLATRSCLLYAERIRDSPYERKDLAWPPPS